MSAGAGFPPRLRVRKRRHFLAIQRGGRRVTTAHFVVYGKTNRRDEARIGITVSRKVGKAVTRNRVKRWVREAFRQNREQVPKTMDLVMVARHGRVPPDYATVVRELLDAGQRLPGASKRKRRR